MTNIYSFCSTSAPPLASLKHDWFGNLIAPAVSYGFALTQDELVFRAERGSSAVCHPEARSGIFKAELWRYDCAEFFLSDPVTGNYLEFNLSPNGAHWACLFGAPLERISELVDIGITSAGAASDDSWQATGRVPRGWLEETLHFSSESRLNATFILDSPEQRFLTAAKLGGAEPNFHQPAGFGPITLITS